jgi:hypothetical protein
VPRLALARPVGLCAPIRQAPKPQTRRQASLAFRQADGVVFLMLQVAVKDGEVFKMADMRQELTSLGPLAGARADIVAGLPRFGRSSPEGVVRFADGTSHLGLALVGGLIRRARAEVVDFNTLARAATPPPSPPPTIRVECVYCRTMNAADLDRCDHCGAPIRLSR